MSEIQRAIRQVVLEGIADADGIVDALAARGFDRVAVVKELVAMVGPEAHPEDRWEPPSKEDLVEIRALRMKIGKAPKR